MGLGLGACAPQELLRDEVNKRCPAPPYLDRSHSCVTRQSTHCRPPDGRLTDFCPVPAACHYHVHPIRNDIYPNRERSQSYVPEISPSKPRLKNLASTGHMVHTFENDFKVDRLLAARGVKRGIEYIVAWQGYGADGDTWKPEEHIKDRRLISDFKARRTVSVSIDLVIFTMRDRIARRLLDIKGPTFGLALEVEMAADPAVAHAVIARLSRPRVGLRFGARATPAPPVTQLEITDLEHIAELVRLHGSRPSTPLVRRWSAAHPRQREGGGWERQPRVGCMAWRLLCRLRTVSFGPVGSEARVCWIRKVGVTMFY